MLDMCTIRVKEQKTPGGSLESNDIQKVSGRYLEENVIQEVLQIADKEGVKIQGFPDMAPWLIPYYARIKEEDEDLDQMSFDVASHIQKML